MAPTQRHRWLTLPDSRDTRRRADMAAFVLDRARADFDDRYPNAHFGPVVALIAAYEEGQNIGDVLKAMPTMVGISVGSFCPSASRVTTYRAPWAEASS